MKKKNVFTVIQILITVAILCWLFHDKQKRDEMVEALLHANYLWILAGIGAYGVVEILGATRWQILLKVQDIYIPWLRLGRLLMIGILFNPLLPGGTGGDVVKIYYLLKETPNKKTQALLAVLMDRLIGLTGLIIVAGTVIIWKWSWLTQNTPIPHFALSQLSYSGVQAWLGQIPLTTKLLYILLIILGATMAGLVFSFVVSGLGITHKLPQKFPKRDIFIDLTLAYNMYAKAWKETLLATFLSFGVHIFSFLTFYCGAMSIHVKVPILEFCAVMPIVNTLSSLPISVGGTGVRETLFQTLLNTLCNVKKSDAVVISLLGYAITLFWAGCGSIIYLFYRPSEHAGLGEIRNEVGKFEHDVAEGKE